MATTKSPLLPHLISDTTAVAVPLSALGYFLPFPAPPCRICLPSWGWELLCSPGEQPHSCCGKSGSRDTLVKVSHQLGLLQAVLGRVWMVLCGHVYMHGHIISYGKCTVSKLFNRILELWKCCAFYTGGMSFSSQREGGTYWLLEMKITWQFCKRPWNKDLWVCWSPLGTRVQ